MWTIYIPKCLDNISIFCSTIGVIKERSTDIQFMKNKTKNKIVDTLIDSVLITSPKFFPFDNGCLSLLLINHYSDLIGRNPQSLSYEYSSKRTKGFEEPFIEVSFTLDTEVGPIISKDEFNLREDDEFSIFEKMKRIMENEMKLSVRRNKVSTK